jgi:hypothetical protein
VASLRSSSSVNLRFQPGGTRYSASEAHPITKQRGLTPLISSKLFINVEPGAILTGRIRELVRTFPNQTEVTVKGIHFVAEDSPDEIGEAVASFVQKNRAK